MSYHYRYQLKVLLFNQTRCGGQGSSRMPVKRDSASFLAAGWPRQSLLHAADPGLPSDRTPAESTDEVFVSPSNLETLTSSFINADPIVHVRRELPKSKRRIRLALETNELLSDPVDAIEVFYHIKNINDPEHPYSLEQVCFSLICCSRRFFTAIKT